MTTTKTGQAPTVVDSAVYLWSKPDGPALASKPHKQFGINITNNRGEIGCDKNVLVQYFNSKMAEDSSQFRLGLSRQFMNRPAEQNFPDYATHGHKCMTAKHLTLELYERLFRRVTHNGVTLDKCIQPSVDNTGRIIGLIAGDEESYEVFKDIFDLIIEEKHLGFKPTDVHPPPDLDSNKLGGGQLDPKYVRSCRIRTGRSVRGYCFPPAMSRSERRGVEICLTQALSGLRGDLEGKYYPLGKMTPEEEKQLIQDHFLFQKPTGHLMVNSGAVRDWPDARGIWHNKEKTFLVWVNEEDHCRVISMENGGNMQRCFERFGRGLTEVERLMKQWGRGHEFMHHPRLGYLCACPSNIGTGLRCSVHVQLKNLSKNPKFDALVWSLELQKRGTAGEHTEAVDDVYDISNRARLKKTERDFVQLVINGVRKLIQIEQHLENGMDIDDAGNPVPKKVEVPAQPAPQKAEAPAPQKAEVAAQPAPQKAEVAAQPAPQKAEQDADEPKKEKVPAQPEPKKAEEKAPQQEAESKVIMAKTVEVKDLDFNAKQHIGMYTTYNFTKFDPEANFPVYTNHQCMVRKHLTKDMYKKLYPRVTANGVTLDKCIQVSVDYTKKCVGLLAGDEESYEVFNELFDAVIDDKHGGFGPKDKHPQPDLDAAKLQNGNLDEKYVKSCRVRTGRSVRGLPFPGVITRAERREVEKSLVTGLTGLKGDLAGTYYPLSKMTPQEEQQLQDDHFLFQKPTGFLMAYSNSARDWPDARGIFHNKDKNFLVWINEEDHCRVISMQKGGNMTEVFGRFGRGLMEVEKLMKEKVGRQFMHSDRLGYICACPTNIGTGLRCSVHIQLHNLCKHPKFEDIVVALNMQARGTGGEHTAAVDDIYDLSNSARLKRSEREFVQILINGILKIIEMEKRLEAGKSIDDLIPK